MNDRAPDPASALVDPHGNSLSQQRAKNTACPRCGAAKDRRVLSGGFGQAHDVCGACGHDFPERTL